SIGLERPAASPSLQHARCAPPSPPHRTRAGPRLAQGRRAGRHVPRCRRPGLRAPVEGRGEAQQVRRGAADEVQAPRERHHARGGRAGRGGCAGGGPRAEDLLRA
ncbi:unnamed protein product, partial [Prorocentrum cordatum]